jgi:hypothetical protein
MGKIGLSDKVLVVLEMMLNSLIDADILSAIHFYLNFSHTELNYAVTQKELLEIIYENKNQS